MMTLRKRVNLSKPIAILVLLSNIAGNAQTWRKITIGQFAGYSPMLTIDNDGYLQMGDSYQYTNSMAQDPATLTSGSLVNYPFVLPSEDGSYFPAMRYRNGLPHIAWRLYASSGAMGVAYWNPTKNNSYDFYFDKHGHYPSLQVSENGTVHIWYQADDDPAGVNVFYKNSSSGAVQKMIADGWDMGNGGLYDYTTAIDKNENLHWLGAVYRPDIGPAKRLYHNYTTNGTFKTEPDLLNYVGYFPSMAVDENNNIHAVWQNGDIWYSKYNGATWTTPVAINTSGQTSPQYVVYQQVNNLDMRAIRPIKNNMKWAWTCGDGGIFMTNNNWETFDIQYVDGSGYKGIFPYDTLYAYCVGDAGKLWRTRTGGLLLPDSSDGWEEIATGFTNNLNDCWFLDSITGYAVGQSGLIIKTTNRGDTWTQINHGLTTRVLNSIYFVDDQVGYVAGYYGTVLKTTDGGDTWTNVSVSTTNRLDEVFAINKDTLWVVGQNKTVRVSYNGGTSWTSKTTGLNYLTDAMAVWFVNDTLGYLTGSRIGSTSTDFLYIYKTINGGTSWEGTVPITGNNEDASINGLYFINENLGFACGGKGKIFRGVMGTDADYYQPGIAIDQNGYCHVAYWGWSDKFHSDRYTYYVNNMSGSWSTQQLIGTSCYTGQTDGNCKLAFDYHTNTIYVGALAGSSTTYGLLLYTRDINIRKATTKDITTTVTASTALTEPTLFDISYNSDSKKLAVFDFRITDIANDGLNTKIKKINIQRGPQATAGVKFSDLIGGAYLYWGTDSIAADSISDYTIQFGNNQNIFTQINEGSFTTFTLKTWLKPNASFTDGSNLSFKISAAHDVGVDSTGSLMTIVPGDVSSGGIAIKLKVNRFVFSGLPATLVYNSTFTIKNSFKVSAVDSLSQLVVTATCNNLSVQAVLSDSVTPVAGTFSITPSGLRSLANGEYTYTSCQISQGYQYILLKVTGTIDGKTITGYSDSIKVLPYYNYLVYKTTSDCTTDDELIGSSLGRAGIQYDVLNRCNYSTPTLPATFLDNYKTIFVDEKNMYAKDSIPMLTFLANSSVANKKGLVIFGSYIFGYKSGLPSNGKFMDYFGIGEETIYPTSSSLPDNDTVILGITGDLVSNGLRSFNSSESAVSNVHIICPSPDSANTRIVFTAQMDDPLTYKLPVAIRHKGQTYKTFRTGFYIDSYGRQMERDTLLNRIVNWINTDDSEATNRTPAFTSRYNSKPSTITTITEDLPFSMSVKFADFDGDAITASPAMKPSWLSYSTNADSITLTGTPGVAAVGDTIVHLQVSDPDGNYTLQSTRLRISHVNHKPGLSGTLPDSVKVGMLLQAKLYNLDPDTLVGDTHTYILENASHSWLSVDNYGILSGTPALSDTGTYTATVIIEDSYGDTASLKISTTVYYSENLPLMELSTNSVSKTLIGGQSGTSNFRIYNRGSDILSYTINTDQIWLGVSPDNGNISNNDSTEIVVTFNAGALSPNIYNGIITVLSNDAAHPSEQVSAQLTVDFVTGAAKRSSNQQVRVYYNRGNTNIIVEFTGIGLSKENFSLIDDTGRKLYTMKNLINSGNSNIISISTKELHSGVYYLVIYTDKKLVTKKIIIQ